MLDILHTKECIIFFFHNIAPLWWQTVWTWLLPEVQYAAILFITCCFYMLCLLLIYWNPLFIHLHFAYRRERLMETRYSYVAYIKVRIVTSVYCPVAATVDVAPLSCCLWTFMARLCWLGHTYTLVHTVTWILTCCIYKAPAEENHFILKVSINKSALTRHPPSLCTLLFVCPLIIP